MRAAQEGPAAVLQQIPPEPTPRRRKNIMDMSRYTDETLELAIQDIAGAVYKSESSQKTAFWVEFTSEILKEQKSRKKRAGKIVKI